MTHDPAFLQAIIEAPDGSGSNSGCRRSQSFTTSAP
jgi:hypothetical protein